MVLPLQELTDCEGDRKATLLIVHLWSDASCWGARAAGVHSGETRPYRERIRVCACTCICNGG